jgi:predicted nucleic acid-binding protein
VCINNGRQFFPTKYHDILLDSPGFITVDLSKEIAEEAARLWASYKIQTPDAIQLATAIKQKASFFLTNDMGLPSLPGLKVLTLDELKTRP